MRLTRSAPLAAMTVLALGATATAGAAAATPTAATQGSASTQRTFEAPQTLRPDSIVPVIYTAGSAQMSPDVSVADLGETKYGWVKDFDTSSSSLTWTVTSTQTTQFRVTAQLSTSDAVPFVLTDDVTGSSTTATTQAIGWQKPDLGVITIPAGTSHLTLTRLTTSSNEADVKSIELLPQAMVKKYANNVAARKADASWLTKGGYGLFFQYGAWGYPQTGPAKSLDDQACSFDVPKFVSMVQSTGAAYVIWSYTWYTYQIDGPNPAVDKIMGNNSLTAKCDLVGQVASALHTQGIKFVLYYHNGHQTTDSWWTKQNFPASFQTTGTGDRSTFFKNWAAVVGWAGNHYGSLLDGWWFDDGLMYYPADFSALEAVARRGNPSRLVAWNPWIGASFTDYQDYTAGETCNGSQVTGSPINGLGIYTAGPQKGLTAQCLDMLNQDWGVHDPNTTITNTQSVSQVMGSLKTAAANNTALTFNLMMYEDGTVNPDTLALLQEVKSEFRDGNPPSVPSAGAGEINNTSTSIVYTGQWGTSSNRDAGDYQNDVSYSNGSGASFSVHFTGTGISYVAPKGSGYSQIQLTLDGNPVGTVDPSAGTYTPQQTLYSVSGLPAGSHLLTGTSVSTGYIQTDAFIIAG